MWTSREVELLLKTVLEYKVKTYWNHAKANMWMHVVLKGHCGSTLGQELTKLNTKRSFSFATQRIGTVGLINETSKKRLIKQKAAPL